MLLADDFGGRCGFNEACQTLVGGAALLSTKPPCQSYQYGNEKILYPGCFSFELGLIDGRKNCHRDAPTSVLRANAKTNNDAVATNASASHFQPYQPIHQHYHTRYSEPRPLTAKRLELCVVIWASLTLSHGQCSSTSACAWCEFLRNNFIPERLSASTQQDDVKR